MMYQIGQTMSNFKTAQLEQFVEDCHLDYAARGLEQGNPMHGEWNKAHHPTPKCLGGTEWVWLLKKDHAKHGVIQSDCYDRCCVWSWEYNYLEGEMLEKAKLWKAENGRRNMAAQTYEQRSEYGKKREANKTEEEKVRISAKTSETIRIRYTQEERSERARNAVMSMTPEKRRENARLGGLGNIGGTQNLQDEERERRAAHMTSVNQRMNKELYEDPDHPEIGLHNAGNLVKNQKRLGLPHEKANRRKVTQ